MDAKGAPKSLMFALNDGEPLRKKREMKIAFISHDRWIYGALDFIAVRD